MTIEKQLLEEMSYQSLFIKQQPLHFEPKPTRWAARNEAVETKHITANVNFSQSELRVQKVELDTAYRGTGEKFV